MILMSILGNNNLIFLLKYFKGGFLALWGYCFACKLGQWVDSISWFVGVIRYQCVCEQWSCSI